MDVHKYADQDRLQTSYQLSLTGYKGFVQAFYDFSQNSAEVQ